MIVFLSGKVLAFISHYALKIRLCYFHFVIRYWFQLKSVDTFTIF